MAKCVNDGSIDEQATECDRVYFANGVRRASAVDVATAAAVDAIDGAGAGAGVCCAAHSCLFIGDLFPPHISAEQCMRSHLPQLMLKYFKSDLNLFISNEVMWCIIFLLFSAAAVVVVFLYTFVCRSFTHCAAIKYLYIGLNLCTSCITHRCRSTYNNVHKRNFYENITIDIGYNIWSKPFPFCLLLLVANGRSDIQVRTSIYCDVSDSKKKRWIEMSETCPSIVLLSAMGIYMVPD